MRRFSDSSMIWLVLAVLSAFFAALVPIFAKIGLAEIDSSVATVVRAIVMMIFMFVFVLSIGKGSQPTQLSSKDMGFIVLSGIAGVLIFAGILLLAIYPT